MHLNRIYIFLAIYSGLFCVLVVRTIVGPFGTIAFSYALQCEQNLVKNIELLRSYQKDLLKRQDDLLNNEETQKLLARKLGFYQLQEKRLVIYEDEPIEDQPKIGYPLSFEKRTAHIMNTGIWLFVIVSLFMYFFIFASNTQIKRY